MAFGEMRIMPNDFYRMRHKDFARMCNGFENGRVWQERIFRKGIARLLEPYSKTNTVIDPLSLWYIRGDEELKKQIEKYMSTVQSRSLEVLKMIKDHEAKTGKPYEWQVYKPKEQNNN